MAREKPLHRWIIAVAAAASAAIVVAAAAGVASSTTSSATAAQASQATGPVVDVWTAAPIGAVGASAPQRASGLKAAFGYLNSHGGLGKLHQKVVVHVCNTQLTPQGEIQCGQQAVSDPKAIAVVGSIIVISTQQFMTELQKAGLPAVNPAVADPSVASNPISFPLGAENFGIAACAVMAPPAVRATRIGFAVTTDSAAVGETNDAIAAAKKAGFTSVGRVEFPITTTDVTPYVTQLAQKNPQVVDLDASPQNVGQWLAAEARIGKSVPTCTTDALTPPQVLLGLGSAANNFYVAASVPDAAWTGYPLLAQFRKQATAEVAAGDQSASLAPGNSTVEVLGGWLGAQALIQAAANVNGAITRTTLLNALRHTTVKFGTGSGAVLPPIDFSKLNPNPKYRHLFNTRMFLKKWDPAKKEFVAVPGVKPVYGDHLVP